MHTQIVDGSQYVSLLPNGKTLRDEFAMAAMPGIPEPGEIATGLNTDYRPPVMRWNCVELIAPVGFAFGIASDCKGTLSIVVRPAGEDFPAGYELTGVNEIAPGHKCYVVQNDERAVAPREQDTSEKLRDEQRRRTYYQSIVYDVCNKLDRVYTPPCVCGTADSPTTQVQDRLESLIEYRNQIAPSPDLQGELVAALREQNIRLLHIAGSIRSECEIDAGAFDRWGSAEADIREWVNQSQQLLAKVKP